jgi:16S rRNA processing protein RimM
MTDINKNILVGKIVAPQGIRGEVRVQTFTASPIDLKNLAVFADNVKSDNFHFVRVVPNTGVVIARIDGVNNRNIAETLRGTELFIERDSLPPTKPGEYYQADLIGMGVIRDGMEIGRVSGFQNFGAGDIIELENGDMVSFHGANVDFDNNVIYVK